MASQNHRCCSEDQQLNAYAPRELSYPEGQDHFVLCSRWSYILSFQVYHKLHSRHCDFISCTSPYSVRKSFPGSLKATDSHVYMLWNFTSPCEWRGAGAAWGTVPYVILNISKYSWNFPSKSQSWTVCSNGSSLRLLKMLWSAIQLRTCSGVHSLRYIEISSVLILTLW